MSDDEIERLVAELRTMLVQNGFGWAAEQAEQCLPPEASPAYLARALIQAAESVTVDLADAEITMLKVLGVGDVDFKPDLDSTVDGGGAVQRRDGFSLAGIERLHGSQRLMALEDLAGQREAFDKLRAGFDGID